MDLTLQKITEEEKPVLRNLMELYLYDYSEFSGEDIGKHGVYGYGRLDHYWTDEGRHPLLIRVEEQLAGFVLVSQWPDGNHISEFFVMRKYRRRGIGTNVARRVFALFPGRWEVSQDADNLAAQAFWRKTIAACTKGAYTEEILKKGPSQRFEYHGPAGQ